MTAPDDRTPTATVRLPAEPAPGPDTHEHGPADEEYSATVLASHWIQRPGPDTGTPTVPSGWPQAAPDARPGRAEGTVLRFGPGVAAALERRTGPAGPAVPGASATPTVPTVPARRGTRDGRVRRHALPAAVLAAVLAFLAWQHLGPSVSVRQVAARADHAVLTCGETADVVGVVTTDGRPGTLTYRWVRSDGSTSGVLREVVTRGQKRAELHLLWTFQGTGRYRARAELRLLSPTYRTVRVPLTYDCR
ncbi:hypothetical protein [Streptomyces sp. NPDC004065]|uniref:hypothetical protein n=1 Tax=Streptomyces sp. NPDC004065 TaxID=3364689 RepID=UPI00384DA645